MALNWTRREVLKASACTGAFAGVDPWGGLDSVFSAESSASRGDNFDDVAIERLADLIHATEQHRVVDVMMEELRKGLSRQDFLAATFSGGIRYHGHHNAYVAHAVSVVSNATSAEASLLPLFYHVGVLRARKGSSGLKPLSKVAAPSIDKADEFFRAAMASNDGDTATRALLVIAREYGPQRAFDRLWMYASERNHVSGGHAAISVTNTFRTLQATDWRCLDTALQFAVQDEACRPPKGSNVHSVNRERASRVAELQPHWSGSVSDRGAVLELLALYRQGDAAEACATTFDLLVRDKVRAGTVWDAVFLATAELVTRYTWAGPKMLAGHSITCVNALHFMFRTIADPTTRLYSLLEAVEWTNSFLDQERARPALRDRSITEIAAVDVAAPEETLEGIFSLIPPRWIRNFYRPSIADADRAMELAFAWAQGTANHRPFIQNAIRLLCLKSTRDVHDFKFPIALFENYRHASPQWRPHLLAASVYVLHGTEMEDSPIVAQARDRLGLI